MISLILTLAMTNLQPAVKTAQVQTCQWPHTCASVAQVVPCVWPNKCVETAPLLDLAQVQTCQWPHTCGGKQS